MELKAGSQLQNGKYILEKKIGEGGFGITYKGIWKMEVPNPLGKTFIEYPVAIKEFFFEEYCFRNDETGEVLTKSEKGQELFVRFKEKLKKEATILLKLDHPNIVNVSEVFEENNTAYMVMELIDGGNLKDFINKGELTMSDSLRYIKQIAEALEYIHSHNIIHLDVKPANILMDKAGNAKLIDFGIAKQYTDTGQQTLAATVATFSKGYSPIEQYAVNRKEKYGAYTDVYSLGATLYHCLTGEIPIESAVRLSEDLVPPSRLNPGIPTHIERAILKAMELKHKDRFPSIKQFLDALNETVIDSEAGEYNTKTAPLPPGFKEVDTEYIIEPKSTTKSTHGKKTVVLNVGTEKKKKEPKPEKKKTPEPLETEQEKPASDNSKLKSYAMIAAGILILIIGIVIFFVFAHKEAKTQTDSEVSSSVDTVKIITPVEIPVKEEIEEVAVSQPIKEEIKENISVKKSSEASTITKPSENAKTNTALTAASTVSKKSLNINGHNYYGDVRNGKPDGRGKLTYTAHERVSENDTKKTMSEPGDYLDGKWNNGELEIGTLYDKEGNKKATIIIGRY